MNTSLEEQFLKTYEDLSDAIFRHCWFRVYDREKAKDLMQETFIKTWEYISEKGPIDNMKAFIYKVANNLIIDYSRKKKESSLEKLMEDGFDPGFDNRESLNNFLEGKEAVKLMDKLGSEYKEVIIMRHIDDLPVKEIAQILNESENVVSVRIHRGLAKLRELLENNG